MSAARPSVVIAAPGRVVATLAALVGALSAPVTVVGGWAVTCRLRMARSQARPTEDLDVLLGLAARPARIAREAVAAVQGDPAHPCRLSGLPLLVDLLAEDQADALGAVEMVEDPDGLRLLVPPFAVLLARAASPVRLADPAGGAEVAVGLPSAGALFAAKVANLALEHRPPAKRASDGEDAMRLATSFGALALAADLAVATPDERARLARLLAAVGGSGLRAQAAASGFDVDVDRAEAVVDALLERL